MQPLTWYFPDMYGPGQHMWIPDYLVVLMRQQAESGSERAQGWMAAIRQVEPTPETDELAEFCHQAYLRSLQ